VGTPIGVRSHLFQLAEAELQERIRNRHTHAGVVLVAADALNLDAPIIEEKAALRIEANGPKSTFRSDLIRHPIAQHGC